MGDNDISDLPMTREQIAVELLKCDPGVQWYTKAGQGRLVILAEHILRISTIALREENKRLRSGEFICCKCLLRKDAENFFKDGVPF